MGFAPNGGVLPYAVYLFHGTLSTTGAFSLDPRPWHPFERRPAAGGDREGRARDHFVCETDGYDGYRFAQTRKHGSFSSGGPTFDGRVKPDLVAPGDSIDSAYLTDSGNMCAAVKLSGTSMATPLASGSMALLRQYFYRRVLPHRNENVRQRVDAERALLRARGNQRRALVERLRPTREPPRPAAFVETGMGSAESRELCASRR